MTEIELDLYVELAPKLNEYRGEWQPRDAAMISWGDTGEWRDVDYWAGLDTLAVNGFRVVWLPLPIDPSDPERIARGEKPRGLWGMLTSSYKELSFDLSNGPIETYSLRFYIANSWRVVKAKTPTEVLLLALKER